MKKLSQFFLKGLLTILPVSATLYILYWLGSVTESGLGSLLKLVLPESLYIPGMGIIAGAILIVIIGILVNAYIIQTIVAYFERILHRIPLVKTIYSSIKDVADFASGSNEGLQQVVRIRIGEASILGFLTNDAINVEGQTLCAVYIPLSYQIGGTTLLLDKSAIETVDMEVKDAMRFMLTAGIAKSN